MIQFFENRLYKHIRFAPWFMQYRKAFLYTQREEFIKQTMEYIATTKLEGDYLEFGVFEGRSFVAAHHLAQRNNLKGMKFYAFDSFEGLPAIAGEDEGGEFSEGEYSCSLDDFTKLISKRGVRMDKVNLVKGWYDQVLNGDTKKRLSI